MNVSSLKVEDDNKILIVRSVLRQRLNRKLDVGSMIYSRLKVQISLGYR